MYEFDMVLEKGANFPKKEKDMWDSSVFDPVNATNKARIKMKHKNEMSIAYIMKAFEMNMQMSHVNKCKSSDWPNELA